MNQIIKMVEAGSTQVPVDVSYNPNMVATAIDLTTLHFAAGAQVDGNFIINSSLITKDNAKDFDYANTPF
jgi:ribose transport system substrate-binding protein